MNDDSLSRQGDAHVWLEPVRPGATGFLVRLLASLWLCFVFFSGKIKLLLDLLGDVHESSDPRSSKSTHTAGDQSKFWGTKELVDQKTY